VAINEHPATGTLLLCDFRNGFKEPEMVKLRPVVVISPKISVRPKLCTVVPLSTQPPQIKMAYHYELASINPALPPPYNEGPNWIKGDMVVSVGFHRLDFFRYGKDWLGKRVYRYEILPPEDLKAIRCCVLSGLGLAALTKNLP
jgi:uncharacterized protein YifN (PemK superfamily)